MSGLLPLLMTSDPWELQLQEHRRTNCEWNHFGMGVTPNEIQMLKSFPRLYNALRKGHDNIPGDYEPLVGKNGYQVSMDVRQFRPNEISVKTVDSNVILIEAKHEERLDVYGSISRQFTRKYLLPNGFDTKEVFSTLSSDGILTIKVPSVQSVKGNEHIIHIQQTGPAHLNVKDNLPIDENINSGAIKKKDK